ncbi:hypothetical protein GN956_G13844 [Arapaima gigas]
MCPWPPELRKTLARKPGCGTQTNLHGPLFLAHRPPFHPSRKLKTAAEGRYAPSARQASRGSDDSCSRPLAACARRLRRDHLPSWKPLFQAVS